ncbi:MAG: Na+/H+ antiporter NhaA [Weeksellaceae bacterium]|nr:Na+/H+ antiporter NhaA [Weeksellaceae bacterium]
MEIKTSPIDKVVYPVQNFMNQSKAGGIVLGIFVILALILANSPWSTTYFEVLNYKTALYFDGKTYFNLSLLHWINDGLMAIFFFVVGLELKREFVGGELSNPRKALLPIMAALGGMIVPATIYLLLNPSGEAHSGWGIPMATDIAFALGVLYLFGNKIPFSLKVFLTAFAIIDDLGAVIVIAFFYTSEISLISLSVGLGFVLIMLLAAKLGVRNVWLYAILGIGGVWVAFLLSGVHATIAAVLAAFAIPADVKIKEAVFLKQIKKHLKQFESIDPRDDIPNLTEEQVQILSKVSEDVRNAVPPLQRLEHAMHPYVTFLILPIFALANAGVSLVVQPDELFSTNIAIGVALGLIFGKIIGITGTTFLLIKLKIAPWPTGMNLKNLFGLSLLGAIGFTMSLFITSLAFTHEDFKTQAKIGIFVASLIAGISGYWVLNHSLKK